jgi:hypothetical protein
MARAAKALEEKLPKLSYDLYVQVRVQAAGWMCSGLVAEAARAAEPAGNAACCLLPRSQ